jgi:hypothetical protein
LSGSGDDLDFLRFFLEVEEDEVLPWLRLLLEEELPDGLEEDG